MNKTTNIFVCGHRKSGTSLLINLLDGHPNLSVLPFDLTIFYGYFPNEQRFKKNEIKPRLKKVIFDNWQNHMYGSNNIDLVKMQNLFFNYCENNYKIENVYSALLNSFEEVTFQTEKKFRITKETSLEIHANDIENMFPGSKFIHVVRNPLDNFASINSGLKSYYKNFNDTFFSLLHSLIDRVNLGLRCGLKNRLQFGEDRYLFVRYEDLVESPENIIPRILKFVGVPVDKCCFSPSVLGYATPGNSFVEEKQYKITNARIGTYKSTLNKDVVGFINLMLSELMSEFGYEVDCTADENVMKLASAYYDYINKKNHFFDRFK